MRASACAALASLCLLPSAVGDGLRVALHAQSKYELHGWVAGSEITTAALARALRARADVADVAVFAPFSYGGLFDRAWDVALVEGYIGDVPSFVRVVRAVSPRCVVLHWCLDTYPRLSVTLGLDVDGFVTNSARLAPALAAVAPVARADLAAELPAAEDDDAPRGDDDDAAARRLRFAEYSRHDAVYVGQYKESKHELAAMLGAVATVRVPVDDDDDETARATAGATRPVELAIYGIGWDRHPDDPAVAALAACCWRGALPVDDLVPLYRRAGVVLGTTEVAQRALGMVNNRA